MCGDKMKYKNYLVLVKDNEVILDISLKDDKEETIIKEGYELVQFDDPVSLIVDDKGKLLLYEEPSNGIN